MRLTSFLCVLLCCPSLVFSEGQAEIIDELKGVLLVPSQKEVLRMGVSNIEGFDSKDLEVPGGVEELNKALSFQFIGSPVTRQSLVDLKTQVILYYRNHGYPVVLVEIPEQSINHGVVQLVVIQSKLENLKVTGNKWFSDSFYDNKFSHPVGQPLHSPTLLDDLAWLNRNPFQNANLFLSPGASSDTTDVNVIVSDRFPLRFYAGADNTGNQTSEYGRLFAGFNWGYAFFLNQILSYQYTTSPDFKSFYAHTINYTMLFPWKNSIMLYGGMSGVKPSFIGFKNTGKSYQASLRYQIPLGYSFTSLSQEISTGFDFKRTNTNVNFVPEQNLEVIANNVNLFQLMLGYSLAKSWDRDQLTFLIEGYGSPGEWMSDQSNGDYNKLSPGAKHSYFYTRGSWSYLLYLPRDFSMYWFLRGQVSTTNLLPSEELGIGGYDTVRGYEERLLNLDNAVIFNFEVKTPSFPLFTKRSKTKDELLFLAFFDYGGGNYVKEFPGQRSWYQIYSAGPGIRYHWGNYISFRLDWGLQIKKAPFSGPRNVAHVGFMASY